MIGRVTQEMMSRGLLGDLDGLTGRIAAAQRQISSGRQITKPSDDPLGTQRAIGLRGALEGTQQHTRNVADAEGWLQTTDDAMGQMSDLLNRARELAIKGGSDSSGPEARQAIALEIDQLAAALKQNANASYQGTYVFSGTATTTPPYTDASDAYQGDAGVVARTIGPGVSAQINTLGADLLGSGQAAGDGKLLVTLRDVADHLRSAAPADHDLLRTTDLSNLETNLDTLSQARASVGAVMSRLDAAKSRLSDVELTTTKLLSDTEDVDIAKAVLELSSQQTVYQSALRAGASIIQPSLLDFLK